MMTYKKIKNFKTYLHNCDCLQNSNNVQIYKHFLIALSDLKIQMNYKSFIGLTEQETRAKLNAMIDYFIAEGIIVEDPVTGKIRTTTDEELNAELENF
ncbi:MAG: hypothetical protein EB127_17580 [Alphaproteobacteria bacterium]|nr:hypothetical protein [Alphaproteobacteria bacterium]